MQPSHEKRRLFEWSATYRVCYAAWRFLKFFCLKRCCYLRVRWPDSWHTSSIGLRFYHIRQHRENFSFSSLLGPFSYFIPLRGRDLLTYLPWKVNTGQMLPNVIVIIKWLYLFLTRLTRETGHSSSAKITFISRVSFFCMKSNSS